MFREVCVQPTITFPRTLDLAAALRALRLCANESLAETALRLAVSKTRLERIERGQQCPTDEEARRWAEAYNMDAALFCRYASRLRARLKGHKLPDEDMLTE